jgi:hypothetical protein
MVIGNIELTEFAPIIAQLEKDMRRPINYVLSAEDDWELRIEREDAFAMNVMRSSQVQLIGGEDAL